MFYHDLDTPRGSNARGPAPILPTPSNIQSWIKCKTLILKTKQILKLSILTTVLQSTPFHEQTYISRQIS